MATKWIDEQEGYIVGECGFLISHSHEAEGWESYQLRSVPARTNVSRVPRLIGWCGSYNNISTSGCGVWKVTRVAKNGRMLIQEATVEEVETFLEEMGYPGLTEDD